jgi:hypothetical protein
VHRVRADSRNIMSLRQKRRRKMMWHTICRRKSAGPQQAKSRRTSREVSRGQGATRLPSSMALPLGYDAKSDLRCLRHRVLIHATEPMSVTRQWEFTRRQHARTIFVPSPYQGSHHV